MKGGEYFGSLQTSVVITEKCNVTVKSEELIGTARYLTLYVGCRINRCRYNRALQYMSAHSKASKLNPA